MVLKLLKIFDKLFKINPPTIEEVEPNHELGSLKVTFHKVEYSDNIGGIFLVAFVSRRSILKQWVLYAELIVRQTV